MKQSNIVYLPLKKYGIKENKNFRDTLLLKTGILKRVDKFFFLVLALQ